MSDQRVVLAGRIDVSTVADVRQRLHDAVDSGHGTLVVDLEDVELTDVSGLGALLGAHRRAQRRERTLVLTNVPIALARMLAATRLSRVLAVRPAVHSGA